LASKRGPEARSLALRAADLAPDNQLILETAGRACLEQADHEGARLYRGQAFAQLRPPDAALSLLEVCFALDVRARVDTFWALECV